MRKFSLRTTSLAGLLALIMPLSGFSAAVETDVNGYLQTSKPRVLEDYPAVFEHVYGKHAPDIKESTYVTVVHYYDTADKTEIDDAIALAGNAVTAAIARANAEMADKQANGGDSEDLRGFYTTDAVCGVFKGALSASYKQTTAAWKTVEGSMKAALASGVDPSLAGTVVSRGIDACLDEKLQYKVWMFVQHGINTGLAGSGASYSYLAPTSAYLSPTGLGKEVFKNPVIEDTVCVANCDSEPQPPKPPLPPQPPVPSPSASSSPAPSPTSCVSNCI